MQVTDDPPWYRTMCAAERTSGRLRHFGETRLAWEKMRTETEYPCVFVLTPRAQIVPSSHFEDGRTKRYHEYRQEILQADDRKEGEMS